MKKFYLFLVFLSVLWACGDAMGDGSYRSGCSAGFANCTFQGTSTFLGPVTNGNSCATGFTRINSNLCTRTGAPPTGTTLGAGCTAINLNSTYGVPATAKGIVANLQYILFTGTAAGDHTANFKFYSDSGCTNRLQWNNSNGDYFYSFYDNNTVSSHTFMENFWTIILYTGGASIIYATVLVTNPTGGSTTETFADTIQYMD